MSLRPKSAVDAPSSDWTVQAADTIEQAVSLVRDKATVPVRTAARVVVYGLALGVVSVVATVLGVIGAGRVLIAYLPVGTAPNGKHRIWIAYVVIGGILTLFGLLLLRKAESSARESQ